MSLSLCNSCLPRNPGVRLRRVLPAKVRAERWNGGWGGVRSRLPTPSLRGVRHMEVILQVQVRVKLPNHKKIIGTWFST